jgi:hypothetical protein
MSRLERFCNRPTDEHNPVHASNAHSAESEGTRPGIRQGATT